MREGFKLWTHRGVTNRNSQQHSFTYPVIRASAPLYFALAHMHNFLYNLALGPPPSLSLPLSLSLSLSLSLCMLSFVSVCSEASKQGFYERDSGGSKHNNKRVSQKAHDPGTTPQPRKRTKPRAPTLPATLLSFTTHTQTHTHTRHTHTHAHREVAQSSAENGSAGLNVL